MGMILFYPSVDCPQLEILLSPPQYKCAICLNDTIRNVDSISKFKSELNKIDETENHAFLNIMYMVLVK
jgi:hypothetical protein